jgi:hypothetical protein
VDDVRHRLAARKRQIQRRLDKSNLDDCSQPVFTVRNIDYEIADRILGLAWGAQLPLPAGNLNSANLPGVPEIVSRQRPDPRGHPDETARQHRAPG